eukprot:scaffold602_cov342-Prasinococcus_capsulatus_cf.AAC.18
MMVKAKEEEAATAVALPVEGTSERRRTPSCGAAPLVVAMMGLGLLSVGLLAGVIVLAVRDHDRDLCEGTDADDAALPAPQDDWCYAFDADAYNGTGAYAPFRPTTSVRRWSPRHRILSWPGVGGAMGC